MRINYKMYPVDYIRELKAKGPKGAKKAMAFWDYWDEMQDGIANSMRFYAKRWEVSVSTAHTWIKEFDEEIDKFFNSWKLKNQDFYSSVKKRTERIEHLQPNTSNASKSQDLGEDKNTAEQNEHPQPNENINIYNDDNIEALKEFENLFFIYAQNTKFPGKKTLAYKEFVKKIHKKVDAKELAKAILLYLHDPARNGKRLNFANFIKEEAYIPYMRKYIAVFVNGEWKQGVYDSKEQLFIANDGFKAVLLQERLAKLFAEGKLKFIRNEEAA